MVTDLDLAVVCDPFVIGRITDRSDYQANMSPSNYPGILSPVVIMFTGADTIGGQCERGGFLVQARSI